MTIEIDEQICSTEVTHCDNDEEHELASFGIRKFNSAKFENSDDGSILVRSPVKSDKRDRAFAAFCAAIPVEDALPSNWDE